MVKIHYKIMITGIICLSAIFITLVICGEDGELIRNVIIGLIAMCIGVIVPNPKIDNRRGFLKW